MLSFLPQLVVSGIATGMLYALMALSMTVGYRATTVVNFGQGDMLMIGAYASYVLVAGIGLPFGAASVLAGRTQQDSSDSFLCQGSGRYLYPESWGGLALQTRRATGVS